MPAMSKPLIVEIPHQLGKQEAVRRLRSGFSRTRETLGGNFAVIDETWSGEHLDFRVSVLGQTTTGAVDVMNDRARIEIQLPWLLGLIAERVRPLIEKEGRLMLERPKTEDGGQTTENGRQRTEK
jgi:hypothetical protein